MNTHSCITGLLLSALLLPNTAWSWDDGYRSQANRSGYSRYNDDSNNYRPRYQSNQGSRDYDRYERLENKHESRESPQEYQYRKQGEYNQAKINQQVETERLKAEYEQEKYRMQAEYQMQLLQK